jgi:hypothetical protein
MTRYLNLLSRGLIIWLVPLLISFLFYTPQRELVTSYAFFKSVMVMALVGVTLAVNLIRPVRSFPVWQVALVYTLISLLADILVLVPFMRLTLGQYVEQIALMYVIIPALTWALLSRPINLPAVQQGA